MNLSLRPVFLFICLVLLSFHLTGQTNNSFCPSDEMHQAHLNENPDFKKKKEKENAIYRKKILEQVSGSQSQTQGMVAPVYTLPVVFHIIHSGEVVGAYNNHSESYIVAKVAAINEAMRGTQTSSQPTYPNVSNYGVDPEIELCLAHEDPNGNYTNGIVRYYAPDIAGVDAYPGLVPTMAWDTDKYVNIIINTTLSVTAYYTGAHDVIVGRPGIGAMAHELGHYLSLAHTFAGCTNNNCLLDGDRVCDTPPSSAPTYDAVTNTCSTDADDTSTNNPFRPTSMGGLGDVDDMLANMMDYGSPGALFSAGQATKMRNNIEVNRMNLVNNNIVCSTVPTSSNDAGVYYVSSYHDLQCSNNAELNVHFTNFGSATLTSVEFEVVANNVVLNTVSWTGSLSSGATTHQAISSGDIPIGNTTVTVRTKLPNGSTDGNVSNDGATIDFNLQNSDECYSYSGCQTMNAATEGGPGNTTILNISEAFPSVALIYGEVCVDAFGDIYSPTEAFNIYDEDGTLRGVTLNAAGDCSRSEQFCFNMTNTNYSNWIQDGAITLTFDPITTAVDPTLCSTLNEICATINIGYDYPCTGAGSPCSDNDACTINDSYDSNCNCIGTFLDGDGDGVCNNEDICPGVDDATVHTLYLQLDWYSQETSWELKEGNTVLQSASYTTDNRRDYFEEQFCLASGCYDFVIYDSSCSGIVTGADGFFTIEDPNGNVLGTGSNFGCNQTVSFCIVEDACDGYAVNNLSPDPLTHYGTGSNTSTLTFSGLRTDVEFDITGINSVTNGNPGNQYNEQVTVSYTDINNNTVQYGVFVSVSSVNVTINEPIQGITVSLTDALDGDAGSLMQIDMSSVTSCPSDAGCPSGATCSSSSPLPTIPGIYTGEQSVVEGDWTYYCDCDGNLLLALDKTNAPTLDVSPAEVSIEVADGATYYPTQTGFVTNPYGAAFMNTRWEVNPSVQPGTGEEVGVKFYYLDDTYNALKDTLSGRNTSWTVAATTDLTFFKVIDQGLGDFPAISNILSDDLVLLTNGSSSTSSFVDDLHPNAMDHYAEFKVTSFSGGGGGAGDETSSPLPVELTSFTAIEQNCERVLRWTTASEENNSHFGIQKSYDGITFSFIGNVEGMINSAIENKYTFVDESTNLTGRIYYRLMQVDLDGTFSYSPVVTLVSECLLDEFTVYPNPMHEYAEIGIETDIDQPIELQVKSINGTRLMIMPVQLEAGWNSISIPFGSEYPAGIYIVQVKIGWKTISKKIIKTAL